MSIFFFCSVKTLHILNSSICWNKNNICRNETKIIFVEKNKRRMGGETKKGEGGRRSERKEEREAGDVESNKISSNLSSAKPLCSIFFPLFCR